MKANGYLDPTLLGLRTADIDALLLTAHYFAARAALPLQSERSADAAATCERSVSHIAEGFANESERSHAERAARFIYHYHHLVKRDPVRRRALCAIAAMADFGFSELEAARYAVARSDVEKAIARMDEKLAEISDPANPQAVKLLGRRDALAAEERDLFARRRAELGKNGRIDTTRKRMRALRSAGFGFAKAVSM